jgi:hypothetical protein
VGFVEVLGIQEAVHKAAGLEEALADLPSATIVEVASVLAGASVAFHQVAAVLGYRTVEEVLFLASPHTVLSSGCFLARSFSAAAG